MGNKHSRGRLAKVIPVVALVALLGSVLAVPVGAQGAAQDRVEANVFFGPEKWNACTEEMMLPQGWVHITEVQTPRGIALHINGQDGYAVGKDSGAVYRLNGGLHWILHSNGNETFVHNAGWIGSDPGQRYHLHERYHVTYTPDGDQAVEIYVLDEECR